MKKLFTISTIFIITLFTLCSCGKKENTHEVELNLLEDTMGSYYDLQMSYEEKIEENKLKINALKNKLNSIEELVNELSEAEKQEEEYQDYVRSIEEYEKAEKKVAETTKETTAFSQTPLLNLLVTDEEYTKEALMEIFRQDNQKSYLSFTNSQTREEKETDTFSIRISNVMDSDKYVLVKKVQAGDTTAPWVFYFESVAKKEEEKTLPGQGPNSQNRKVLGRGNAIENETDETSPLLERTDISVTEETTRGAEFEVKSFEFLD